MVRIVLGPVAANPSLDPSWSRSIPAATAEHSCNLTWPVLWVETRLHPQLDLKKHSCIHCLRDRIIECTGKPPSNAEATRNRFNEGEGVEAAKCEFCSSSEGEYVKRHSRPSCLSCCQLNAVFIDCNILHVFMSSTQFSRCPSKKRTPTIKLDDSEKAAVCLVTS